MEEGIGPQELMPVARNNLVLAVIQKAETIGAFKPDVAGCGRRTQPVGD